ncbi:MAG: sigma-70 family RNA polymerase sigma factor [Rikenellaceae bacterium]|nr:sigma-70 family RNA polymerase sigma factor [Rikenellaceae bacterium]MCL2692757.1 sigma-70 family RNA polymerase sigma factor [Rikenellaceae bacterium]
MGDKELMHNIVQGDREAFNLLTVKYYPALFMFAESIIPGKDAAKDIVQEAFVYLWEKRKKLTDVISVKNYLYTAVRNYCYIHLRSSKLRANLPAGNMTVQEEDIHYNYVRAETIRLLSAAIDTLPSRTAEVIRLTLEGLRQEKIAESMNITVATVKLLKARGIIRLRELLGSTYNWLFML